MCVRNLLLVNNYNIFLEYKVNTIKSRAECEKIHKRNEGTIKGKAKSIRDHVDFFMNDIINEFHGCTLLMLSLIRLYIIEICKKKKKYYNMYYNA